MAQSKQWYADKIAALGGTVDESMSAEQLKAQYDELTARNADLGTTGGEPTFEQEFGTPDKDGNRFKAVAEGKQVRVHMLMKDGKEFNTLVDSEAKGKEYLPRYVAENFS